MLLLVDILGNLAHVIIFDGTALVCCKSIVVILIHEIITGIICLQSIDRSEADESL